MYKMIKIRSAKVNLKFENFNTFNLLKKTEWSNFVFLKFIDNDKERKDSKFYYREICRDS